MNTKIIALAALLGVSTAQISLAQATELIGHVQGLNKHSVVAEVPGVVEMNNLEVGDAVNQQQILAQIKADDFKFSVNKAKANLVLAEADLALRKATYNRYQALIKKNSLSVGELDTARAKFLSAKAAVSVAQIDYQQSQVDLENTQIDSLISGYISNKPAQSGAWVSEGDLLYEVVNIDKVTLSFMASEYDLKHFSVGQEVVVWSETNPEFKMEANVQRIGVEMQNSTYPVLVEITNQGHQFKPGMSVYASTDLSMQSMTTAQVALDQTASNESKGQ
ncbi:efflux RND transporter periplasmic adaptor subunit [Vibrio crassostreae]|uniref:Secretion protein HlyD n=1 Tax=Vibrio crassostreae TaxID=246167 RepID=A0ABM9QLN1_9VIBR|nr:efflux RND transporter periplasmic adaptor subunit [Vibrio crassostreae]TCL22496.1 RND family efflux transporter MFP subunit [Vibrio crassostreae]TCT47199.1 RND family efflux transporter MFP subunit [Vibrio crassostreae]TCT55806.1 RND family efflux transporter MFP subunit [Vibrio crassostreae]CAK1710704.1 putative Secretion protein HlyD [Vibrio crassostreae]CAK1711758.1 putative Secretion protein HlyD [Vibrio crassostreae]